MIRPLRTQVLLKQEPDPPESDVLVMPTIRQTPELRYGEVLAVGNECRTGVGVGDRVVFIKGRGLVVDDDGPTVIMYEDQMEGIVC